MNISQIKSINPIKIIVILFALFGVFKLFTFSIDSTNSEKLHQNQINDSYHIFSLSPPQEISFAGNKVPMDDPEVYERLDREIHSNAYFHSNTILYFKRANRWFPVIEPILKLNNIPDDFKYLSLIESGLQNVVSPAGATGYWQFLEATGKEYGLEINDEVDERYHVEKATQAACNYLNDAYEIYKNWELVAASYNAGKSLISSELERQKATNYYDLLLNSETERYVFRILAAKHIMENPNDFGFNIRKKDLYPPLNYTELKIDSSISDFADFAHEYELSYKALKYFNPWLRQGYLKNPSNKSYTIKLPSNKNYLLIE